MTAFKSILVDIDAAAPAHPALDLAIRLASRSGARLTLVDVLCVPPAARHYLPPDMEEALITDRRTALARAARAAPEVAIEPRLLIGRPMTELIQEVLRGGHDLLVRAHARDVAAPRPRALGAVDHELLRQCPCPVLLVGPGRPNPTPRLLAAVDASSDDPGEQALNVRVVELTLHLAQMLDGTPSLLYAWEPFAERLLRSHVSDNALAHYVDVARQRASVDLARLTAAFGDRLIGVEAVLRRGRADDVIPELVVSHGVDLVVMGTLARSGIAGLMIGNTAERVLRALPCSVLAVKPAHFVSAIRPPQGT